VGATYDQRTAAGKSAKGAFAQVTAQASWEEGHGGYSGSLAQRSTTSRRFQSPPRPPDVA
jgi:hypothetical protein